VIWSKSELIYFKVLPLHLVQYYFIGVKEDSF